MRIIIFTAISFVIRTVSIAQTVEPKLKDMAVSNLISYHIRYALEYDLGIEDQYLARNENYFFDKLLSCERELMVELRKTELTYPIEGYNLYHFWKRGFRFKRNDSIVSYSMSSLYYDDDYLVAYNSSSDDIKFISGNFFKTKVSNDFNLDKKKPNSFIKYIQMKFFNVRPVDIAYTKTKKGRMLFSAKSQLDGRYITFIVSMQDFDDITIQYAKKYIVK